MRKVLLHACCAPCAAYPVNLLKNERYEPVVYFYNPNIFPKDEHDLRLDEIIKYSKKESFALVYEPYSPDDFENIARGFENEPEKGKRCEKCILLRLNKTAQKACELKIKYFTSALTISPHKISKMIFEAGEFAAKSSGIEFLKYDFKKRDGFKIAQQIALQNNMYKQNYCGCKYSIRANEQQS